MSSEDPKPDTEQASTDGSLLDPTKTDKVAEQEFKKRYGIRKAPPGIAQRKISATGGKQYFDSGDYNRSANRQDKKAIASMPHVSVNPQLAHVRGGRPVIHKTAPSKLAGGNDKSPLAS